MNTGPKTLSDDPLKLKEIIAERDQTIHDKQHRIDQLEAFISLQKHRQFGASSEKSPDQGELFDEVETLIDDEHEEDQNDCDADAQAEPVTTQSPAKKSGRKPLPAELPRIRIEHDLPEADKSCDCGCQLTLIGEETSEQLDIIPAKVQVLVHVRKKYGCAQCEARIKLTPLPPQPIPKSMASPGLLAYIATAKYQDGLPLYRQEAIFKRMNIELGRNTQARWMIKSGEALQPLWNLLQDQLLSCSYIHADETPVQVLKEPDKTAQSRSYMWVRVSGLPDKKVILFDYAPGRGGNIAQQLLSDYKGYLQTDDYAGYNAVCADNGTSQLGCWAHARRKFIEAQKAIKTPKGQKAKNGKADVALNLIGKLYGIERTIKDKSIEERYQARQRESLPVLKKLRSWLNKALQHTLPKGLLGKALGYLDRNWNKLNLYTQAGYLNIDNNPAENAIRPFVIGRKNWLFSDTPQGAKASAILYSIIETAKANDLEPFKYLSHVFKRLPTAKNLEEMEALLPWNMNKQALEG
jgi:transposase